jgi:hypothetical protein
MNRLVIRNIVLSVALVIALTVVLLTVNRTPFGRSESSFACQPVKGITRIELVCNNEKLELQKEGTGWLVYGSQEVRKSAISFIISILTEMRIKSPISRELFEREISEKNVEPVRVRVYENKRVLSSFLVYKTGSNVYGNIMKLNHRTKPFITYLPGFEGDIGSVFNTDKRFWQPYTVFNLRPSEISSVTLQNFSEPGSSFAVTASGNKYILSWNGETLTGWDTARVKRYLSYFTWIPFENWVFDLTEEQKAGILSTDPAYEITVKRTDGAEIYLTLLERNSAASGVKDSDRLWGRTGESKELFIIRYFDIDPVLKKRAYFFTE